MPYKAVIQFPAELSFEDIPSNIRHKDVFTCRNKEYVCIRVKKDSLYYCDAESDTQTTVPQMVDSFFWIREV